MRTFVVAALVCAALASGAMVFAEPTATAVVCTEVANRAPVGAADRFPATVGKLVCFSEVRGASGKVVHVWFRGDKEMLRVDLAVGGERWRTWSVKKIIPEWTGAWRVEVRAEDGTVLATTSFAVE